MKLNKDYMTVMRVGRAAHKRQARRSFRREKEATEIVAGALIAGLGLLLLAAIFAG